MPLLTRAWPARIVIAKPGLILAFQVQQNVNREVTAAGPGPLFVRCSAIRLQVDKRRAVDAVELHPPEPA